MRPLCISCQKRLCEAAGRVLQVHHAIVNIPNINMRENLIVFSFLAVSTNDCIFPG